MMISNINVNMLTIKYHEKKLLYKVNVEFYSHNVNVILGESGAGKSTLLKALLKDFYKGTMVSGEIYNGNINIFDIKNIRKYRGRVITYIPQNPMNCFDSFVKIKTTFKEIILSHHSRKRLGYYMKKFRIFLKKFNLNCNEILNLYPYQLSGGMLQRIMLSILLTNGSNWIILDEPTSSIDLSNVRKLIDIINELKKSSSVIIATHDLNFARSVGDYISLIKSGKIYASKPSNQILWNSDKLYAHTSNFDIKNV